MLHGLSIISALIASFSVHPNMPSGLHLHIHGAYHYCFLLSHSSRISPWISLVLSLGHTSVQREKQETESPFLAYLAMLSQLSLPWNHEVPRAA